MVVTRHMKGTNRATFHHLNKKKLHMLTTHLRKQVNIFGFSKFCKIYFVLVMQIFMNFLGFANFYLVSCNSFESGKRWSLIQVTPHGVLPQASCKLTAVGWG